MPKVRLERILAVAHALFLRHGFAATTMDAVAREAGVGKQTLYAHFPGKDQLFAAIVARAGERHAAAAVIDATARPDELVPALLRFARGFLALLLSPDDLAAYRCIAAESARSPELGRMFYDTGPASVLERLALFLEQAMQRGELRPVDPRLAAAQLVGLVRADLQLRAVLGVGNEGAAGRELAAVSGVDGFLRIYRPEPRR